jgi:hypothetical protein
VQLRIGALALLAGRRQIPIEPFAIEVAGDLIDLLINIEDLFPSVGRVFSQEESNTPHSSLDITDST